MKVAMLTTTDNPFDPFDNFDEWEAFDTQKGYNTCSYLARIVRSSDDLSIEDQNQDINDAIDEIVKFNINGMYKKIEKDIP